MIDFGFPEHEGKAIKIMAAAFSELNTNDIEKVIFCHRRDRVTQAEGLHKISQLDLEIKEKHGSSNVYIDWFKGKSVDDVYARQELTMKHIEYIINHDKLPRLDIMFEDIVTNPRQEIEKVVQFLELDVDISKAINNVDVRNEASV
jgi:endo-1,4-beta-mannosidase